MTIRKFNQGLALEAALDVNRRITVANPSGVDIRAIYNSNDTSRSKDEEDWGTESDNKKFTYTGMGDYARQIAFNKSLAHAVVTKTKLGANVSDKDPRFLLEMGRRALETSRYGRCDQIAAAVIHRTFEMRRFIYDAEMVFVGNHHFVVFGRSPISSITRQNQWGDGFIVDVWRYQQRMEDRPVIDPLTSVYFNSNSNRFQVSGFFRNPNRKPSHDTNSLALPAHLNYL